MVHCHCSTSQTSSSSSLFSTHSPGSRQPNHLRNSWLGRQPQQQAPQPASPGSQLAYAARPSRLLTSSVPIIHRNVCVAAHHRHEEQDLPVSLYWPYKNLPPDGQTRTEKEESCNPEEKFCQTPMHVFERACKACTGTGSISSNSRGRRRTASYVCTICHGLGYVRHTSSRFMPPSLNNGSGDFTIGRPVPPPPEEDDKKRKYRSLRR
ncbi:hypothetical protein WJX77_002337 [Trebouxia sp. C0004]